MEPVNPLESEPGYRPQLDALRGVAVTSVVYGHWGAVHGLGDLAVQFFFVLSGFLITGILLRARADDPPARDRLRGIRTFYARRFLRIFPLYYAVLLIGVACNVVGARDAIGWHLVYGTNFYVFLKNNWVGAYSHFWSLAVEEQFYVLWPWLIFLAPRVALPWLVAAVVAGGMFFASQASAWMPAHPLAYLLLPYNVVALGAGAFLATLSPDGRVAAAYRWFCFVSLAGRLVLYVLPADVHLPDAVGLLMHWSTQFACVWVVAGAARGFRSRPARILLENPPILFLGTVSYGLYVLHPIIGFACRRLSRHVHSLAYKPRFFAFAIILLLLTATVSWFAFERPLNRLKRYFPYRPGGSRSLSRRPAPVAEAVAAS